MPDFQRLIDIIAGALSIFDFSFIISGSVTYFIILLTSFCLGYNMIQVDIRLFVLGSVLVAYVLGLLSWIIGSAIRDFWQDKDGDFKAEFDSLSSLIKDQLPSEVCKVDTKLQYTYLWIQLSAYSKERETFANNYWVRQAMFEGLSASCLFAIISVICIYLISSFQIPFFVFLVVLYLLYTFFLLFLSAARKQARYQIREVVLAYYSYSNSITHE